MRSPPVQHAILGLVILATLLWLDVVPAEALGRIALLVLVWAIGSTLLVAAAGAWVALARSRRRARG